MRTNCSGRRTEYPKDTLSQAAVARYRGHIPPDLRPGDRGKGVSVAVGTHFETGIGLIRELVGSLEVRDSGGGSGVRLEAGQFVSLLRIRCEPPAGSDVDPYVAEFECSGRIYTCPLYCFQARTRILASVEEPRSAPAIEV
jgi:hypothetical protein